MALRALGFVFVFAAVAAAEVEKKRKPAAPMDIVYGTTELMYDMYAAAYEAADTLAQKHGVHRAAKEFRADAMTKISKAIGEDPLESACIKLGCKKKDVQEKLDLVQAKLGEGQAALQQVKAQASEYMMKASDFLNDGASKAITKFEIHVPSYKGVVPKTFGNLLLAGLYVLFVTYVVLRIIRFVLSFFLSIFCCVCCCRCCRKRKAASPAATTKNGKKAAPDAKATPKQAASAKGKAKK